jgi:hypothetical protein
MAAKLRAPVKVIHGDALQVMSGMPPLQWTRSSPTSYCSGAVSEAELRVTRQGVRTKTGNPFRWFVGDKMGTATRAEQELYGDKLYEAARGHAGLPADAKTHGGWGAWGTENNPLYVETYRPGGTTDLDSNPLVWGPAESLRNSLRQEAYAANRWNPLPLQRAKDATAIMLKLPKNASRDMVEALNKKYGGSMVVAHRPDKKGVFLTPFSGKGRDLPSLADLEALVPGSKVRS